MKKVFLLMVALPVFIGTLSAQITQKKADEIVQQRLEGETRPCSVYAKEGVQTGFEVITSTGETLELDYPVWVYYVSYTEAAIGKYLIVKESNGNLLEINPKNDVVPNDLEDWRMVISIIPFEEYSLEETSCEWIINCDPVDIIIVNSAEELENYISCTEGSYPAIDFLQYTLLLACGVEGHLVIPECRGLQQFLEQDYVMHVNLRPYIASVITWWHVAIITDKIADDAHIELIVTKNP